MRASSGARTRRRARRVSETCTPRPAEPNVLWLAPDAGAGGNFFGTYGREARLTGAVRGFRRAPGVIEIDGRTLRIHPAQLQGIVPGEFVSVRVVAIGNVGCVTGIRPAGGRGPGGAGPR